MTADPRELELLKAELARQLEERKIEAAWHLENRKGQIAEAQAMFAAASSYANGAMRGLLLINGGAIAGILTFLGNLQKREGERRPEAASVVLAVEWFGGGLVLAVAALGLSYLAQVVILEAGKGWSFWLGGALRILAVLAAAASLGAFVWGALQAAKALAPIL